MKLNVKETEVEAVYEQSFIEKCVNLALCRSDLAKEKLDARPVSLLELFRFASVKDRILIAIGSILAAAIGIGQPLVVLFDVFIANVFLKYSPTSSEFNEHAMFYLYILSGVGLGIIVVSFLQFLCFKWACTNIVSRIREEYMNSILRQNAAWYDRTKSGTLTARLNENIDRIKDGIGEKISFLIRVFFLLVTSIVISFVYEWRVTLVCLPLVPVSLITMSSMARCMNSATTKAMTALSRASAIVEESIMNVRTVAAYNGQEVMVNRCAKELAVAQRYGRCISKWESVASKPVLDGNSNFSYGVHLYYTGVITEPVNSYLPVMCIVFGSYYLGIISPHLMSLLKARVAASVVYNVIDQKPFIDNGVSEGSMLQHISGRIEFSDVRFSYAERSTPVLDGLSFIVEAGQSVALVGHSGSGKSSTVSLLTRLYEYQSGVIKIDGMDLRSLNVNWLRNTIGVVQQEPLLFNGTVAENVRLGRIDLSDEQLRNVCRMANAHEFIEKLSEGYDTVIRNGGVQLSGGQKQRIAIARTLARNPKILLLDEATSALDAESEASVQSALRTAAKGRTTIVIAHRLSTLRHVSKIVVIQNGKVAEQGSHQQLMTLNGLYAKMVEAQRFEAVQEPKALWKPEEDLRKNSCISMNNTARSSFHRYGYRSSCMSESVRSVHYSNTEKSEIMPTDETRSTSSEIALIFKNSRNYCGKLIVAFLACILRSFELPMYSVLFGFLFLALKKGGSVMMHDAVWACLGFLVVGVLSFIAIAVATSFFGWTAECVSADAFKNSLHAVLHQPGQYFDDPEHSPARLVTRITADAPMIKAGLDSCMMQMANNTISLIVISIVVCAYCWEIGLGSVTVLVLLVSIEIAVARRIQRNIVDSMKNDKAGECAIEIIEQVRTIQLLTRSNHFLSRYVETLKVNARGQMRNYPLEAISYAIAQSCMYVTCIIGYAIGVQLAAEEKYTVGTIFIAVMCINCSGWAVMYASGVANEIVHAAPAANSIYEIIGNRTETKRDTDADPHEDSITGNVDFRNVDFAYPARPQLKILNGLNITAVQGRTLALVGPSGGGKSTVIALLERIYEVTGGSVKIDDKDVRSISLSHLRTQMSLVGQEPVLFSGTIAENVSFGMPEETKRTEIIASCKQANAHDFIGYETEVGERGSQLSGGQKQRIAIARALIRKPKILLLDEATSALDAESEKAVQIALNTARSGRTCITIAHRLSSIQNADQIAFIEAGKVVECGTHAELVELDGKYASMIRKQDMMNHNRKESQAV